MTASQAARIDGDQVLPAESDPQAQLARLRSEFNAFEYAVSHDLRAPLRAIEGFSQALEEDCASNLDAQALDYLLRIRKASVKVTRMVEALVRLSRIARHELRRHDLDLSAMCANELSRLAARDPGRTVEVRIESDVRASGDPELLSDVLGELLGNAWRFTSKRTNARIEFSTLRLEGGRVFRVLDNGEGFASLDSEKLGVPFQLRHASDDGGGVGIGIAVAKRIVERHGGMLWATSVGGEGATLCFTLGELDD
jgi:light-regulated signal transduction histidine kinase (bacteriophytochrome)